MTHASSLEIGGDGEAVASGPIAVALANDDDFDGWRDAARRLAAADVRADQVRWQVAGRTSGDLFVAAGGDAARTQPPAIREVRVPRAFLPLAEMAALHSEPERFSLLYELLLRLQTTPRLLDDHADLQVRRAELLGKAVRRDMHKMRAFVRFREVEDDAGPRFVAWFEPDHHIVRANAGFFVRRFAAMRWSILTPALCIHWDGERLTQSAGATRAQAPTDDQLEEVWTAYYRSIFNPARLKVAAMVKEMPRRYWKNLPEAASIATLIAGAQAREASMTAQVVAPAQRATTLAGLAGEAQGCRRCSLWQDTNGCVFGEGPGDARLMVVGEQPGDEEDRRQQPFVGPAGQVFDRALGEAGIDRTGVYVTNAVKHFKFALRGKRRLHQTPEAPEIDACRWWIDQEVGLIRPRAILMLGATAIRSVTGRAGAVSRLRGSPIDLSRAAIASDARGIATYHPSYVLRIPDPAASADAFASLVSDLRLADEAARSG